MSLKEVSFKKGKISQSKTLKIIVGKQFHIWNLLYVKQKEEFS